MLFFNCPNCDCRLRLPEIDGLFGLPLSFSDLQGEALDRLEKHYFTDKKTCPAFGGYTFVDAQEDDSPPGRFRIFDSESGELEPPEAGYE